MRYAYMCIFTNKEGCSYCSFPTLPLEDALAAAAKSLQSCPTLCDPIDGSPQGSPVPGILQAGTLEWVAISFSNAWGNSNRITNVKVLFKLKKNLWLLCQPLSLVYSLHLWICWLLEWLLWFQLKSQVSCDFHLICGCLVLAWKSLGLQGDPTSPFWRRSALGVLWREWC